MWILEKKCKEVGKNKTKQIIYQKPGDCLKHLIRGSSKMCAKDQEIQVLKQNPCMDNWQSKGGHCGWGGRITFLMVQLAKGAKQENPQNKANQVQKTQDQPKWL